jgi:hypothetical protein
MLQLGPALLAGALATLALWVTVPAELLAHEAEVIALAQAYNAAWSAQDVGAVLAFFAPEAVIYADRARPASDDHQGEVVWATGAPQLRGWVQARLASNYRVQATNYRGLAPRYQGDGDAVAWDFKEYADPHEALGIEPLVGTAIAVVRAGHIVALYIADDPMSVERRDTAYRAALLAHASPSAAGQFVSGPAALASAGPRASDPTERIDARWAIGVGCLGAAAAVVARLRRDRRPLRLAGNTLQDGGNADKR